jgi:hypothetical protein
MYTRQSHCFSLLLIIILDASRKNPYPSFGHRGLANTSSPTGFVIAYPTEKGKTIRDDQQWGINSLYIKHLTKVLETATQNPQRVEDVFMQVTDAVIPESGGQQEPTHNASLKEPFCFGGCKAKHQANAIKQENDGLQDKHLARENVTIPESFPFYFPFLQAMAEGIKGIFNTPGLENSRIRIEGHTNNIGRASYNKWLSKKMAQSVKNVLITQFNVPANRLEAVGWGEEKPIATNKTVVLRCQNLRITLILLSR